MRHSCESESDELSPMWADADTNVSNTDNMRNMIFFISRHKVTQKIGLYTAPLPPNFDPFQPPSFPPLMHTSLFYSHLPAYTLANPGLMQKAVGFAAEILAFFG